MRAAFRATIPALLSTSAAAAAARLPLPFLLRRRGAVLSFSPRLFSSSSPPSSSSPLPASTASTVVMALDPASAATESTMEKQFEDFRVRLDESGGVRERIRAVVMEMEAAVRVMHSNILLVHHSRSNPEVLEKARVQIEVLKALFNKLSEILRECSGQYYRYHGDWRSEAQSAVSLIAFLHWLESGNLLLHADAEKKLGLDASEFGLDVEDYLIGLCFMSNELPRYVVNQVTAGDYDCPRKVLNFLTDLHAAFRMLNLRNDFLRKKFDGMKYDVRRVEEVYYDVKIRGLASGNSKQEHNSA